MKHPEHEHQKALVNWAYRTPIPAASDVLRGATVGTYLLAIPNGGRRNAREGGRLKAEGVKPGVSDLLLPLARGEKHGLWIEMKAPKGKPTPAQREWTALMVQAGYEAVWCDDWILAATVIAGYLGVAPPVRARA